MKQQRKKLGLVLGAGAARGFAHIGVIQSFLEHGLPIDVLTGTSMGALLGGVYATGTDINYIADFSQNVAVSRFFGFFAQRWRDCPRAQGGGAYAGADWQ